MLCAQSRSTTTIEISVTRDLKDAVRTIEIYHDKALDPKEVAVFSPTPYAHYLNITINNVERVFGKGLQYSKKSSGGGINVGFSGDARIQNPGPDQSQLEATAEDMSAQFLPQRQTALRGNQNCRTEDDIEILHVLSNHQGEKLYDHVEEDSCEGQHSNSQLNILSGNLDCRGAGTNVHSAPACPNDCYDQLLDDTDLFQFLKVRSSAS